MADISTFYCAGVPVAVLDDNGRVRQLSLSEEEREVVEGVLVRQFSD